MAKNYDSMEIIGRTRIRPFEGMGALEKAVWVRMVNSCSAEHFIEADMPLMAAYCEMYVQYRRAMDELKAVPLTIVADNGRICAHPLVATVKSFSGTLSNLTMRLRLSPSTRIQTTNKAVGSDAKPGLTTDGDETDELFTH